MRDFYRNNGITKNQLYKEHYNFAGKVEYNGDDDPIYLNGYMDEIPPNDDENVELIRRYRIHNPKRIIYTDEMLMYLTNKHTLKMQECWSKTPRIQKSLRRRVGRHGC